MEVWESISSPNQQAKVHFVQAEECLRKGPFFQGVEVGIAHTHRKIAEEEEEDAG
jgi:hypothetical protein